MRRPILFDDVFMHFKKKLETVLTHIICLFVVFRSSPELFLYMETSPLLVRGCKFRPMLGVHGHWAARIFNHVTPTVTRDTAFNINYKDMWSSSPVVKHLVENQSLTALTTSVATRTQTNLCYSCKSNALTNCVINLFWYI